MRALNLPVGDARRTLRLIARHDFSAARAHLVASGGRDSLLYGQLGCGSGGAGTKAVVRLPRPACWQQPNFDPALWLLPCGCCSARLPLRQRDAQVG